MGNVVKQSEVDNFGGVPVIGWSAPLLEQKKGGRVALWCPIEVFEVVRAYEGLSFNVKCGFW